MTTKLIDELAGIERQPLMANWQSITDRLADLMRAKAKAKNWGYIAVSVPNRQAMIMLMDWAKEQGLEVSEDRREWQILYLQWGFAPIITSAGACDATIMADGDLKINWPRG